MKNFLLTLSQGNAMTKSQKETMKRLGFSNVRAIAEGMKKRRQGSGKHPAHGTRSHQENARSGTGWHRQGTVRHGIARFIGPTHQQPTEAARSFCAGQLRRSHRLPARRVQNPLGDDAGRSGSAGGLRANPRHHRRQRAPAAPCLSRRACHLRHQACPGLGGSVSRRHTGVMFVGIALVGLKVSALAGGYAATILSDGWQIAKGIFAALRPSVIAATVAQNGPRGGRSGQRRQKSRSSPPRSGSGTRRSRPTPSG